MAEGGKMKIVKGEIFYTELKDLPTMQQQLQLLTDAINRAAELLERAK